MAQFKTKKVTNQNERGATMVEFAVCAWALFMLVGLLFDVGLALYRYTLLTFSVADLTPRVASIAATPHIFEYLTGNRRTCSQIARAALDQTQPEKYLLNRFGTTGTYSYSSSIVRHSNDYFIELQGTWPLNCFFCIFFPKQISVQSTGSAVIDSSFTCREQ